MINSTRSVGGVNFFSPQRIRWLRNEFDKLPRADDEAGRVLLHDFNGLFVDVFGRKPQKTELPTATVKSTDAKNGTVSFDETLRCMTRVAKTWHDISADADGKALEATSEDKERGAGNAPDILEAFQATGGVSVKELRGLMDEAGLTLTEDDIERMCSDVGAERNEDGSIPYPSFVKLLLA